MGDYQRWLLWIDELPLGICLLYPPLLCNTLSTWQLHVVWLPVWGCDLSGRWVLEHGLHVIHDALTWISHNISRAISLICSELCICELITTLIFSFYYFYPFGSKVHPISFIKDHISKFEVMIKTNYLRPILIFKPNLVNKDFYLTNWEE